MGTYRPLPGPAPIEEPNIIGQYAQIMGIKNQQQEAQQRAALAPLQQQEAQQAVQAGAVDLQMKQQLLKDQQTITSLSPQFLIKDGSGKASGYDFNGLFNQAAASGVSPQTLTTWQKSLSDATMAKANATKAQLENQQTLNTEAFNHLEAVRGTQDLAQRQQLWAAAGQWAYKNSEALGIDAGKLPAVAPDDAGLSSIEAMLGMHAQQIADAGKIAETSKNNAQAAQATAGATKDQAEADTDRQLLNLGGNQAVVDARYRSIQQNLASGGTASPDEQAFVKAYEKQKLLVPQATAQVRIEGLGSTREYPVFDNQTKTTVMMNANDLNAANHDSPGRYTAPGYTPEAVGQKGTTQYFTSGKGGQQITAYNTAMKHLDTLDSLATGLNNSNVQVFNKAAQTWAEQTGNPAPANFAAAKNAMSGEVAAALKASGATDQEISNVGQTFNRAQSPAQLRGAISTYRSLLQSKAQQLQGQYQQGMQGRPNFQGNGAPANAQQPAAASQPNNSGFFNQFGGVAH
jgi:hypothetical protein